MKGRLQLQAKKLVKHLETCSPGDIWEIYQQLIAEPTTWPTLLFQPNWLLQVESGNHEPVTEEPIEDYDAAATTEDPATKDPATEDPVPGNLHQALKATAG